MTEGPTFKVEDYRL